MHLITQAKTGLSALALMHQLGVSYNTAWSVKQKIMQVMKERDDSKPLIGIIQLDDVYWGGERRGGKRRRGSANKVPFVAAVSVSKEGHPIAMNMNVVKGFQAKEIERWAKGGEFKSVSEAERAAKITVCFFDSQAILARLISLM